MTIRLFDAPSAECRVVTANCWLLIASCPRFGELVSGLPPNECWLVRREPSQGNAEARHNGTAAKIHLRIIFVAWLVVPLGNEFLRLIETPLAIMALVLDALVDGERRHTGAREAEVVGAVVMSRPLQLRARRCACVLHRRG